jgi:YidC/Oxa1 family membrane protein insertase
MIDIKRAALYGVLLLIVYTLWIDWQKEYVPPPSVAATTLYGSSGSNSAAQATAESESASTNPTVTTEPLKFVQTDVLKVGINATTGDLVSARLMNYKESLENPKPFVVLNNKQDKQYITSMRLLSSQNGELSNQTVQFSPETFNVKEENDQWIVSMEGKGQDGLHIKKEYLLKKGDYLIRVRYIIENDTENAWKGAVSTSFSQNNPQEDKSSLFHLGSYSGGAISIPGEKLYKKVGYGDMAKENLEQKVKDGWVAMQQHYFLTAWIPSTGSTNTFYSQTIKNEGGERYNIGMLSAPINLAPQQTYEVSAGLYIGPELMDVLKGIAPGLDLTIDYGWLSPISVFIFFVLDNIHKVIGNWGWSIILVTLLIKIAFYRLSAKSYTSMANMRKLQPQMEALKQRFGEDKAAMSKATMELYRKEKVNPLGGCLPTVIQIPVFIGLYWVILESVQLRQAPFIFWIHDLSVPDPYYILPIIMGLTMFIQQKLNPPPPDPTQAKMMMFLPVVFTGLFLHFPAGLVLYWTVNNALSIAQQWMITRRVSNNILKKRFVHKKLTKKEK